VERTIISINIPNAITIVIMASLGYAAVAIIRQMWMTYGPSAQTQTSSGY
jgi:hypothetical protein